MAADFCITAVRYNKDRTHIDWVHVREEMGASPGPARTVSRVFVADLIRLGKASFQTRVKGKDDKYSVGASVHLVEKEYLTTDRNSTQRDNLGNLPEF